MFLQNKLLEIEFFFLLNTVHRFFAFLKIFTSVLYPCLERFLQQVIGDQQESCLPRSCCLFFFHKACSNLGAFLRSELEYSFPVSRLLGNGPVGAIAVAYLSRCSFSQQSIVYLALWHYFRVVFPCCFARLVFSNVCNLWRDNILVKYVNWLKELFIN